MMGGRHERCAPVGLLVPGSAPASRSIRAMASLVGGSDPATAAWSGWLWKVLLVHAPTSAPHLDQHGDGLGATEEGGEVEGGEPVG